jgi:large subunit ribosomal protein L6
VQGKKLVLNLGFSHPIEYEAPEGIAFVAEKDQKGNDIVTVSGYDKQLVGQVAASLRILRKPEPYKGKGVRYFGEKVRQKAGKTAGK